MASTVCPQLSRWPVAAHGAAHRDPFVRLIRLSLSLALLLFLQACRIIQTVPEGGQIVSASGAYDCSAGHTCIIEVQGDTFTETFTAVPDPGYRFLGWKQGLCVGSTAPCELLDVPPSLTLLEVDAVLEPRFEIDVLDLLPASTRGVFQIYPNQTGAMSTDVSGVQWKPAPLQLIQKYSAGMSVASAAQRIVLAQLTDAPNTYLLLARLGDGQVSDLLAEVGVRPAGTLRGFPRWNIEKTGLQLVRLDAVTLGLGKASTLRQAVDVYTGRKNGIQLGPLGEYTAGLTVDFPNSLVYGLPALYGAIAAPGSGATSLTQARAVSASFGIDAGEMQGVMAFHTPNAAGYVDELQAQLQGLPAPSAFAVPDLVAIDLAGLSAADDLRPLLKTLFVDMDAIDYTDAVVEGGNAPWLNFDVGGDPAAIFINFEFVDSTKVAAFEAAHLPAGFQLAPFRMLESDPPRFMMVLNIYQSSGGLVSGARAEWSVFVEDPDTGVPRFLVVDARAESISADSVNLLTLGEPVSYEESGGALNAYVGIEDPSTQIETTYFATSIPWPQTPAVTEAFDRVFMTANDFVFWGNAVADRVLYNSTAVNRDAIRIEAGAFTLTDNTPWAAFLKPQPLLAAVYQTNQEIVISPWWNLDAPYLDVTPEFLAELIQFKNGFYPGTVQNIASAAIRGEAVALTATTTNETVPTAHYHFPLLDPVGLLMSAVGPGAHTPVAVELFADEDADFYLSLAVFKREDDPCGVRAQWYTYVLGADGYPNTLVLDSVASDACLDPHILLSPATEVTQSEQYGEIRTRVATPFVDFEAKVTLALADTELAGLNWLEAGEWVCSLNNVCDKVFYDSALLTAPVARADQVATEVLALHTPWDGFIDAGAARAGVRDNPSLQVFNPWRNLRPFAAPDPAP